MTNANTIQASKKLRKRWPCQKFRVSDEDSGTATVATSLASFHCSSNSASFVHETFSATDPQISQVLQSKRFSKIIIMTQSIITVYITKWAKLWKVMHKP